MDRNRHMASRTTPGTQTRDVFTEALRRSVAAALGPRRPGAVYTTPAGHVHQVRDVITDRAQARIITGRRSAQFAVSTIETREHADGHITRTLHTTADPWDRHNTLVAYGTTRRDPR